MSVKPIKSLEEHARSENAIIVALRDIEKLVIRMIHGIPMLFIEWIPNFIRKVLRWLYETCLLSIRISIRLARVSALLAVWVSLVFGFLLLYPGLISVIWTFAALAGSGWGLVRRIKARRTAQLAEVVAASKQ